MAPEKLQVLSMSGLTIEPPASGVDATIEKQRGFQQRRRTRVSYQKGTIVPKKNGRFCCDIRLGILLTQVDGRRHLNG
jgi:hypothetical protein